MDEKLVFSVVEAGRLLSLGRAGAYEAAKRGDLPTIKIGKRLLVPRAALMRMLEKMKPAKVVRMSKGWDGLTPYPDPMPGSGWTHQQQSQADKAEGYCAAMNGPEVQEMYEQLKQMKAHGHGEGCSACSPGLAMRAYEAGLKDVPDAE